MKRSPSPGSTGGGYKKSRGAEDEMENTFEDELLAMEASEAMLTEEEFIDMADGADTSMTGAGSQRRWVRPKTSTLNPGTDDLGECPHGTCPRTLRLYLYCLYVNSSSVV